MPVWLAWPFIRALLGGALAKAWAALRHFAASLNAQGWIGLAVGCALAWVAFGQFSQARHFKKQSERYERLYRAEQTAHQQTIANYRTAAEKARQDDAANKARVEAEQRAINERTSHDYETRLAAARALAERLRHNAPSANPGGGGGAPVPGIPASTGRPAQAAGQDGFSLDDRLTATEQAIQLDELVKWIKRQHEIPVNKASN